jgi:hypothetical protein
MHSLESQDTFDSWIRILNESIALLSRPLVRVEEGDRVSDIFFWRSPASASAFASASSSATPLSASSSSLASVAWLPRFALLTRSGRLLLYAGADTAARGRRRVMQANDAMQVVETLADGTGFLDSKRDL